MAPDTRLPLQNGIAYDAEHYILDAQHGPRWASEDQDMDRKLTELREEHGTPPNIIHSEAIHSEALRRRRDAHSNFFRRRTFANAESRAPHRHENLGR